MKRLFQTSRGQAMYEFAMTVPMVLTLTLGIIVFGMAVHGYSFASMSAREAVRYAIVHGSKSSSPATTSTIQSLVDDEAAGLNTSNVNVTTTWSPDNNPGSTVAVTVTYSFQPFYPMSGTTLTVSSSSQMVISQ